MGTHGTTDGRHGRHPKASKNARGSAPFHMKHPIKLPDSLPALRHDGRHASLGTQENETESGATGRHTQRPMIRNVPPTPIPTAGTARRDEKRMRKREGTPQEWHRRRPKDDEETPSGGENSGGTVRPAARRADRRARRSTECWRNREEREGIEEPAGSGTGWDAAIIEEKQVIVERAGSADVVLSDKNPTLRGNYPHFYEDKNGELNIYIIK